VWAIAIDHVCKRFGHDEHAVLALDNIAEHPRKRILHPARAVRLWQDHLLRMIAGFEDVSGGEIRLYGESLPASCPSSARSTPCSRAMPVPHMTVAENVAFGWKCSGQAGRHQAHRGGKTGAGEAGRFCRRRPHQLSGGQQQRMALARAGTVAQGIAAGRILVGAGPEAAQGNAGGAQAPAAETGITFVFVTHDQEEALTMSDRIAVMSAGKLQQVGSPEDIYDRPANRFRRISSAKPPSCKAGWPMACCILARLAACPAGAGPGARWHAAPGAPRAPATGTSGSGLEGVVSEVVYRGVVPFTPSTGRRSALPRAQQQWRRCGAAGAGGRAVAVRVPGAFHRLEEADHVA
jgi:spermidine/putrescine transport system ATP-binding protein